MVLRLSLFFDFNVFLLAGRLLLFLFEEKDLICIDTSLFLLLLSTDVFVNATLLVFFVFGIGILAELFLLFLLQMLHLFGLYKKEGTPSIFMMIWR